MWRYFSAKLFRGSRFCISVSLEAYCWSMLESLSIEVLRAFLLVLLLRLALILFEVRRRFWLMESFSVLLISWDMLILMMASLVVHRRILTVTIATATIGNAHQNWLIDISFHMPSFHWVSVVRWVVRRMRIVVVVLLRREIGMVNLLIALWHPIVRIVHWRRLIPSLPIVIIRRADQSLTLVSVVVSIVSNLLSRILCEGVIWWKEGFNLSFLIIRRVWLLFLHCCQSLVVLL